MQINMKPYNYLESFKEKDIYEWKEIIEKIEQLESELFKAEEMIENLHNEISELEGKQRERNHTRER